MLEKGVLLSQEVWEWGYLVKFGDTEKHTKVEVWLPSWTVRTSAWCFLTVRHGGEHTRVCLLHAPRGPKAFVSSDSAGNRVELSLHYAFLSCLLKL